MEFYNNRYYLVVKRGDWIGIIRHDEKKRRDIVLSPFFDNYDDAWDVVYTLRKETR